MALAASEILLDAGDQRFYSEQNRPAYLRVHATESVYWVETRIAFEELLSRFPGIIARGPAVIRPSLATVVVESMPVSFGEV